MLVTRYVEVALTIPDNEAETARSTLQRLGVHVAGLLRSDLYRVLAKDLSEAALVEMLRGLETIYNSNKHALELRAEETPQPGEVWIDEPPHGAQAPSEDGTVRVAGRVLPGVRSLERLVAWRLFDERGRPASSEVVARATETLLCNPAFQRATTNQGPA